MWKVNYYNLYQISPTLVSADKSNVESLVLAIPISIADVRTGKFNSNKPRGNPFVLY